VLSARFPHNSSCLAIVRTIEREKVMTQIEFFMLCDEYNIHPSIALENDSLVVALQERDNEAVEQILKNEF
jgi:hypothetical protein